MAEDKRHPQKLLLFHLNDERLFGIGTLKVREIIPFMPPTKLPQSHAAVVGTISFRGSAVPVIDTGYAVGYPSMSKEEMKEASIIITDVQRKEMGFIVKKVDRIIEAEWKEVVPPPKTLGQHAFITGLVHVKESKVPIQLMDVELLLSRIFPDSDDFSSVVLTDVEQEAIKRLNIHLVDDSLVARKQLCDALDAFNASYSVSSDGQTAYDALVECDKLGKPIDVLVSDIEMPGLDGYELTFNLRDNRDIKQPFIILHTSLNSEMSVSYATQVGADEALTKFDAQELLQAMLRSTQR